MQIVDEKTDWLGLSPVGGETPVAIFSFNLISSLAWWWWFFARWKCLWMAIGVVLLPGSSFRNSNFSFSHHRSSRMETTSEWFYGLCLVNICWKEMCGGVASLWLRVNFQINYFGQKQWFGFDWKKCLLVSLFEWLSWEFEFRFKTKFRLYQDQIKGSKSM